MENTSLSHKAYGKHKQKRGSPLLFIFVFMNLVPLHEKGVWGRAVPPY